MRIFEIEQLKIHPNAKLMQQGTEDSAGYDCYAVQDGRIEPLRRMNIKLGYAAQFTPGYVALLLDKGGMGNKGIGHLAGVIDSDYRDEWEVILYNTNPEPYIWKTGDKIIQAVFVQYGRARSVWADKLSETARGLGKFGSTGTNIEQDEQRILASLMVATGDRYAAAFRTWTHEERIEVREWLLRPIGSVVPLCMRREDAKC